MELTLVDSRFSLREKSPAFISQREMKAARDEWQSLAYQIFRTIAAGSVTGFTSDRVVERDNGPILQPPDAAEAAKTVPDPFYVFKNLAYAFGLPLVT